MSAPVDWLTGERPPLPHRERTPLFDQIEAEVRTLWPSFDQDSQPSMPVQPPRRGEPTEVIPVVEDPTLEFKPLSRWARLRRKLTWQRQIAGGLSGLVLMASLIGRWWL